MCGPRVKVYQILFFKCFFNGSRGGLRASARGPAGTVPSIPRSLFPLKLAILGIFGHLGPNILPRSSQLDAKIAQASPTCGQDRPKCSPRASNQTPQDPKMWPKRCSVVRFYTSAIFQKIAPKTTKNAQDNSPNCLKIAILAPT